MRLRGMLTMAVHPVAGSTDTTIIVSGRTPVRPVPASLPSRRMFTRPPSAKGSGLVVVVVGAVVVVVGGTVVVSPGTVVGGSVVVGASVVGAGGAGRGG